MGHGGARALLAVAQGGVEDEDAVLLGLRWRGHDVGSFSPFAPALVGRSWVPCLRSPLSAQAQTPGRPSGDHKEQEPAENEGTAGTGLSLPGDRADIAARRHHIRPRHARSRNRTAFILGCPAVLAEERPASQARMAPDARAGMLTLSPSPAGERSLCDHRGHVDLEQHARDGERVDHEKRIGRDRPIPVSFPPALGDVRLEADIGDVDDLLHRIRQRGAMHSQQALDLVIGIPALLVGVADMPDGGARARGSVLVLGADPREIDGLARPSDGDDLAEAPLRPFRWIVALDVQALRQRRVSGDGCSHDDGECGPRRVGKSAERAVPTRIDAGHSLSSAAARWFDDHHVRAWARRTRSGWDWPGKFAWACAFALRWRSELSCAVRSIGSASRLPAVVPAHSASKTRVNALMLGTYIPESVVMGPRLRGDDSMCADESD